MGLHTRLTWQLAGTLCQPCYAMRGYSKVWQFKGGRLRPSQRPAMFMAAQIYLQQKISLALLRSGTFTQLVIM
jgi:hypothetical protein